MGFWAISGGASTAPFRPGFISNPYDWKQACCSTPVLFVLYTLGIWVSYILMTYLVFFALEETADLPILFAITAFTMGGIGMLFPSPGGIGSYHFAIISSFVAYAAAFGWSEAEASRIGTNIAFIIHTSQFIMMIVVGFLSYLYLVPKVKVVESEPEADGQAVAQVES